MINLFGSSGNWQEAMDSIFSRYQGQPRATGSPGIKKYRGKRKIRNRMAKLSRRANR